MRSQVAEAAAAGDLGVGHPTPFAVEPVAQRAAVADRAADAGDLAQCTLGDLLLEEQVLGRRPHAVAGGEQQPGLLDGLGHPAALGRGHAHGFLHEQVFARLRRGQHQPLVQVGLRADDRTLDLRIGPDGRIVGHGRGSQLVGPLLRPLGVGIPDILDLHVLVGLEHLDVAGRVGVGTADHGQNRFAGRLGRFSRGSRDRHRRQRCAGGSQVLYESPPGQGRVHHRGSRFAGF